MMDSVQKFYDGFAPEYQSIFANWQQSVEHQGNVLSAFFDKMGYSSPAYVLDCTCGIGTQTIGLVLKGYQVDGEDLSPKSIDEAKANAKTFSTEYPIQFSVVDLLQPTSHSKNDYDIVLAYDNPIAHFQTEEQLSLALENMLARLKSGGLLTTSLRDYDELNKNRPRQSHIGIQDDDDKRQIIFQIWDWSDDGSRYRSEMFVVNKDDQTIQTKSYITTFRAWKRIEVTEIVTKLGMSDIKWHMPEQSSYYQPILTAKKS